MQALVLDFDGVLADSAPEIFTVAWRSYLDLIPGSGLAEIESASVRDRFFSLVPLGNRAEDFGVALAAIDGGVELADQAAFDRFRAGQDAHFLDRFHRHFYAVRGALVDADAAAWCALNPPFRPLLDLLRRRAGETRLAIATAKDHASVVRLLATWGASDLFDPQWILDKETAAHKRVHLERLAARFALPAREITFVDDRVNQLDDVASLGVRCALAAWGQNGPREHALARSRGYLVLALDDAEAQLFEAPSRRV